MVKGDIETLLMGVCLIKLFAAVATLQTMRTSNISIKVSALTQFVVIITLREGLMHVLCRLFNC